MRTAVIQSFRTNDVPAWLSKCMRSTRVWATSNGYSYCFLDDRFFEFIPDAIRYKLAGQHAMLSDIARLFWAKRLLSEHNFDRVI